MDEAESGRLPPAGRQGQVRMMLDEASKPKAPFQETLMGATQYQRKTEVLVGSRFGSSRVGKADPQIGGPPRSR